MQTAVQKCNYHTHTRGSIVVATATDIATATVPHCRNTVEGKNSASNNNNGKQQK